MLLINYKSARSNFTFSDIQLNNHNFEDVIRELELAVTQNCHRRQRLGTEDESQMQNKTSDIPTNDELDVMFA